MKYIKTKVIIFLFIFKLNIAKANFYFTQKLKDDLKNTSQNVLDFIDSSEDKRKIFIDYDIDILKQNYCKKYFAPWDSPFSIITKKELKEFLLKRIKKIHENPGWGFNKQPSSLKWVEDIVYKINIEEFPNINKKGIIIKNTYLRSLPCITPHFKDWTTPGQGYPFDNFQLSYLHAFQPIYIVHKNKSKDWSFIITNQFSVGWVQTKDIAFVDSQFIDEWKNKEYVISIKDDEPIYNIKYNKFLIDSRISQLLPLLKEEKKEYEIFTCECEDNGFAKIQVSKISKQHSKKFPLLLTKLNVSNLINILMNKPYGWGGLYGFRDCTELVRDIFGAFALFLPRNSKWQREAGSRIYLGNLNKKDKIKTILKRGIPFLTLLYFKGHIMLYIGEKDGIPYVFNTIWGLKVKSVIHKEDRAILGKSLIMPLNIGSKYKSIPTTPLDKVSYMILLNDNLIYPELFESQICSGINQLDLIEEGTWKPEISENILKKEKVNSLFQAYRKYIKDIKENKNGDIIFYLKDNTEILWKYKGNNDLQNIFSEKYIVKYPIKKPRTNIDPGNYKNQKFLKSIYGKKKEEIKRNFVKIYWLPKTNLKSYFIYFNKNAGAAPALIRISHQLDKLPEDLKKYIKTVKVDKKDSFGISITLDKKFKNSFKDEKKFKFTNRIPEEIIKIFEENDFIWGGRWYHYDTGYFEYRPEFFR